MDVVIAQFSLYDYPDKHFHNIYRNFVRINRKICAGNFLPSRVTISFSRKTLLTELV